MQKRLNAAIAKLKLAGLDVPPKRITGKGDPRVANFVIALEQLAVPALVLYESLSPDTWKRYELLDPDFPEWRVRQEHVKTLAKIVKKTPICILEETLC